MLRSWLHGLKVSQAACIIKPSIWLCPEGCWGVGGRQSRFYCLGLELGQPEAPGIGRSSASWLGWPTLTCCWLPGAGHCRAWRGADWLVSLCAFSTPKLPGSESMGGEVPTPYASIWSFLPKIIIIAQNEGHFYFRLNAKGSP